MNKFVIQLVSLLAACVILFVISRQLIVDHAIPLFSDFIASSTQNAANSTSTTEMSATETIDLHAPSGTVRAMIADTDFLREQGLSGRISLPADRGMLFVFDIPWNYAFWMKDMDFPLDMVWIDADKKVIGVTKDISPDTYPSTFSPPSPALYVLEINAGSADKFGLATGTAVDFNLSQR